TGQPRGGVGSPGVPRRPAAPAGVVPGTCPGWKGLVIAAHCPPPRPTFHLRPPTLSTDLPPPAKTRCALRSNVGPRCHNEPRFRCCQAPKPSRHLRVPVGDS